MKISMKRRDDISRNMKWIEEVVKQDLVDPDEVLDLLENIHPGKGRSIRDIVATAVYCVLKNKEGIVDKASIEKLCSIYGITYPKILKLKRIFFGSSFEDHKELAIKIGKEYGITKEEIEKALPLFRLKSKPGVAALIYVLAKMKDPNITQREIADRFNVTTVSIRNYLKDVKCKLNECDIDARELIKTIREVL